MEISLKTTLMVYQQVFLVCPASYTLFPKEQHSDPRIQVRLYSSSASNPPVMFSLSRTMRPKVLTTAPVVLHDMTPHHISRTSSATISCCSPSSSHTGLRTPRQAYSWLRAFAHAVPAAWNGLSSTIHLAGLTHWLQVFMQKLLNSEKPTQATFYKIPMIPSIQTLPHLSLLYFFPLACILFTYIDNTVILPF